MICATIGFLISLVVIGVSDNVSWWWLLWGSLIGLAVEIVLRVGAGADVFDAFVCSIDIAEAVSSVGDIGGGDSGGGDSGGGD